MKRSCTTFKQETNTINTYKLPLPYYFPNKKNLNYVGSLPEYKYFNNNISLSKYENLAFKYKELS